MVHAEVGRLPDAVARLRVVADRHGGVFTNAQALSVGVSREAIQRRIERGAWSRYRGALRRTDAPDTDVARAWAAVLVGGAGSALTGPIACRLRGVPLDESYAEDVMLLVPADRHVVVPGVRVVRGDVPAAHVSELAGLPLAGRTRALVDSLRLLPARDATALLDRAVQQRWVGADTLAKWVAYFVGMQGVPQLRRLAQRARDGAHSEAERRALRILRRAGLGGLVLDHHVYRDGRLVARLDLAFPAAKVAVEVDGMAYHSDRDRFQRDRTRQNLLVSLGWTVLRFTWWDLVDRPTYVATTVRRALTAAA